MKVLKCPYIKQQVNAIYEQYSYTRDGTQTGTMQIERTYEVHTDCIKDDCAAWDGKCTYNK